MDCDFRVDRHEFGMASFEKGERYRRFAADSSPRRLEKFASSRCLADFIVLVLGREANNARHFSNIASPERHDTGKVKRKQCAIYNFYSAYVVAEIVARAWATRWFDQILRGTCVLRRLAQTRLRYLVG